MWKEIEITIRGTPAQFAALAYHTSRRWLGSLERQVDLFFLFAGSTFQAGLFYVYGWPLSGDIPTVTVRINASGGDRIDQTRRKSSAGFGWIDARSLPELTGKGPETLLVVQLPTFGYGTLGEAKRQGWDLSSELACKRAWAILFDALVEDGFIDEEEEESKTAVNPEQAAKHKRGRPTPDLEDKLKVWCEWLEAKRSRRYSNQQEFCDSLDPQIDRSTLRDWKRKLVSAGYLTQDGEIIV